MHVIGVSGLKIKESGTPPRQRRPEEGLEFERRGSWKAEWAEVAIDFRCHRSGPKVFGLALKEGWLQVEIKKSVKEDEKEAFDRGGVLLQDMIGVPAFDPFIQAVGFDVPSLMSKTDGTLEGD